MKLLIILSIVFVLIGAVIMVIVKLSEKEKALKEAEMIDILNEVGSKDKYTRWLDEVENSINQNEIDFHINFINNDMYAENKEHLLKELNLIKMCIFDEAEKIYEERHSNK